MVHLIEGKTANELFVNAAKELLENGHEKAPRNKKTLELSDVWLILHDPLENIVTLKSRDINLDYLKGELEWYKSGSLLVEDIAKHSKFWKNLADSNGTVNSNYGFLAEIEKHSGISQLEWCVQRLTKDPETRQAVINYNQPKHKYEGVKDLVCTLTQQFLLRDSKLDCVTLMRSNDMIFGLTYDLPWFARVHRKVAEQTNLPLGKYNHYAASFHVYKKHFDMLKKIAEENCDDYIKT